MNTQELIDFIQTTSKKTPLLALVESDEPLEGRITDILYGSQHDVLKTLHEHGDALKRVELYCPARNSAVAPLSIEQVNARIEFGALIRDHVTIEDHAVIMMGAILNIGCKIGEATMIDMGAVIGARAQIGKNCHIGANAVIAGVLEPVSAHPTVIEDDVLIGANAVVLEGVRIKKGAVVAAGAIVIEDVPEEAVVAGNPARIVKKKDKKTESKTQLVEALRSL